MKGILFIVVPLISWVGFSQKLDLKSENSLREFLNEKEIKVGDYGSLVFYYDKFNRDMGSVDFKVSYKLPDRTLPLKANIMISLDEFSFPNYMRAITLSDPNSYKMLNIGAPLLFQIFENGAIYYQERTTMTMNDYINSITSGNSHILSPTYKLCN